MDKIKMCVFILTGRGGVHQISSYDFRVPFSNEVCLTWNNFSVWIVWNLKTKIFLKITSREVTQASSQLKYTCGWCPGSCLVAPQYAEIYSSFPFTVDAPALLMLIGCPQRDDSCKYETLLYFFQLLNFRWKQSQNQIILTRRERRYRQEFYLVFLSKVICVYRVEFFMDSEKCFLSK